MAKNYIFQRVDKEAYNKLKERVKKINSVDLKKMGIKKNINIIDMTRFLYNNPIYISDNELRAMTNSRRRGRLC
jgi:uncharacterized protein YehS (DUF1456 family)